MKPEHDADAISYFQDTRTPAWERPVVIVDLDLSRCAAGAFVPLVPTLAETLESLRRDGIDLDDTCLRRAPHDWRGGQCARCGALGPLEGL